MTATVDARGAAILKTNNCQLMTEATDHRGWNSYDDSCSVDIVNKQDDGLVFQAKYYAPDKGLNIEGCYYRPNDPAAAEAAHAARAHYDADVARKFGKMGFTVLDTFDGVGARTWADNGACVQSTGATYLLKQNGKLYSAAFDETWTFASRTSTEPRVSDLQPVDRQPSARRVATTEESSNPAPAAVEHEDKPAESKLCVGSCVGPHLDLQTGQVKVMGSGPGYKF